jgi:hypothetical protein
MYTFPALVDGTPDRPCSDLRVVSSLRVIFCIPLVLEKTQKYLSKHDFSVSHLSKHSPSFLSALSALIRQRSRQF